MYYHILERGRNDHIQIRIDREQCRDCGHCLKLCKRGIFFQSNGTICVNSKKRCSGCMKCVDMCLYNAVEVFAEEL